MITAGERQKLWGIYPEVRELFEEYNSTLLEDDLDWARFVDRCHEILKQNHQSKVVKVLLLDTAAELERLAKKRRYG